MAQLRRMARRNQVPERQFPRMTLSLKLNMEAPVPYNEPWHHAGIRGAAAVNVTGQPDEGYSPIGVLR